jgi:phosphatidylglycerol:prolipoprotein diacylglycerol transferase
VVEARAGPVSALRWGMLPYFEQPVLHVGPIPIYAFGLLVVIAVVVGLELAARRARSCGLDPNVVAAFGTWVLLPGFLGAHLFDALWYHPREVAADWSMLLGVNGGLSSFGGFLGALGGAGAWRLTHREPLLPYVDVVLSVFPISWALGRMGCTLAHDHPGVFTSPNNPLAFAYPDGPRWDLGFLELLFSLALSVVFVWLWRRRPPLGTYTAIACVTYAPVRFALDFLRAEPAQGGDVRYAMLTPGQWACIVVLTIGLGVARTVADARGRARRADVHVLGANLQR